MGFLIELLVIVLVAILTLPWLIILFFPALLLGFGILLFKGGLFNKGMSDTQLVDRKGKILLIDDDPTSLLVMQECLQTLDFEYEIVSDPQKAAMSLFYGEYDLVVLDNDLQELSGVQILKQADSFIEVNNTEFSSMRKRVVPVIGYSAVADADWKISNLSHFNILGTFNKKAAPADIMMELDRSFGYAR